MKFDAQIYKYPSRRQVVYGRKGMVATSQPLAAQAGLDMLKHGGNAIDAAIAVAACLTVVEPTSNGIGGDAFALVWNNGKLYGLNSSGPAPLGISIEKLKRKGYKKIPRHGWCPVTVPGVPKAWAELSKKFGKLPFTKVLEPAIEYAESGFPVSPIVGQSWQKVFENYKENLKGEEFKCWFDTFAPKGRAPYIGEIWCSPDHSDTLRKIAETNGQAFYKGELAEKIDKFSKKYGGYIRKEDLEAFEPKWVEPISINYRGYDVWEIPPNGQGLVALLTLNILKGFEFNEKENVETYHKQLEAIKLAFADGKKYITDIDKMKLKPEDILSDEYAEERRSLIRENAMMHRAGKPKSGGTVYLATADSEGNMVSYIQSNYRGFGSGLVVPQTGIALQNRGADFSLNPEDENCLEPGKRSYHTIIPGFLTKNGSAVGPFGVMGAYMQPQGHVQVVMNMIDFSLNPQEALDAPRWQWVKDNTIFIEPHFPMDIAKKLSRRGHDIQIQIENSSFGRGQIILRNEDGILIGGTEPRADGAIGVW
jgi:gamma-glutamyltranspeptidase/glutathione hydrolase